MLKRARLVALRQNDHPDSPLFHSRHFTVDEAMFSPLASIGRIHRACSPIQLAVHVSLLQHVRTRHVKDGLLRAGRLRSEEREHQHAKLEKPDLYRKAHQRTALDFAGHSWQQNGLETNRRESRPLPLSARNKSWPQNIIQLGFPSPRNGIRINALHFVLHAATLVTLLVPGSGISSVAGT